MLVYESIVVMPLNPFPHTTILQQTTFNIFCQKIENLYNWMNYLWLKVENIVAKGEIARFEQFLLLSLCFQKAVCCRGVRKRLRERVKSKFSRSSLTANLLFILYEYIDPVTLLWYVLFMQDGYFDNIIKEYIVLDLKLLLFIPHYCPISQK